jgi:tellurite resistance protein TerC
VALAFFAFLNFCFDPIKAKEFLAGYILERTLGLDNIFVFLIIFNFFKVNKEGIERVLFWGILIAIVLRAIFIFVGAALISKFYFVMYIFGAFLVFTGIKLLFMKEGNEDGMEKNFIVRCVNKFLPTTNKFEGDKFIIKENNKNLFTPLFITMVVVAFSDLIFALDSIPAIFGVTLDPFIVLTANFFSLMGLRAMFSLITHVVESFYYLKYALSIILVFVGVKMLIEHYFHISISVSLGIIFGAISIAIIASIFKSKREKYKQKYNADKL